MKWLVMDHVMLLLLLLLVSCNVMRVNSSGVVTSSGAVIGRQDDDANNRDDDDVRPTTQQQQQQSGLLTHGQWIERERKKQLRIFDIQQRIMATIGFQRPPSTAGARRPLIRNTSRLQETIERLGVKTSVVTEHELRSDFVAKRIQAVLPTCPSPAGLLSRDQLSADDNGVPAYDLYFNVDFDSQPHRATQLSAANLKLYKKPGPLNAESEGQLPVTSPGSRRRRVGVANVTSEHVTSSTAANIWRVSVYSFNLNINRRVIRKVNRRLVKTTSIRSDVTGWLSVNINSTVDGWSRRNQQQQQQQQQRVNGLEVVVTDTRTNNNINTFDVFTALNCSVRADVVSILEPMAMDESPDTDSPGETPVVGLPTGNEEDLPGGQPFLELTTVDVVRPLTRTRHQRHVTSSNSHQSTDNCTVESFYVSFAELGWNEWIIQPQGFETGFCTGTCNRLAPADTVTKVLGSRGPTTDVKLVSDGCCLPSRVQSLGVVYFARDSRFSVMFLDDLIVTDCACRTV